MLNLKKYIINRKNLLNNFLCEQLSISKTQAKKILDQKKVFVNNRKVWIAGYKLIPGDVVEVSMDLNKPQQSIQIVYLDEYYLVVVKEPGISTNGENSLETLLQKQMNNKQICAVHRLDKGTSGLVIFAQKQEYFEKIKDIFKDKQIKKIYRAIVLGKIKNPQFVIEKPVEHEPARSEVRVLAARPRASYLEVVIPTGRKHQIRIHLAGIHHPVLGENVYNPEPVNDPILRMAPRIMLHAYALEFKHPYTNNLISLKAKEPEDFRNYLKKLEIIS